MCGMEMSLGNNINFPNMENSVNGCLKSIQRLNVKPGLLYIFI